MRQYQRTCAAQDHCCFAAAVLLCTAGLLQQRALTLVQALQQVVHRQAAEVLAILIQHGSAEDVAAAQSLRAASKAAAAGRECTQQQEGISSSPRLLH